MLITTVAAAWGGQSQLCLKCHSAHYVKRGQCGDCHRGNPASERKNIAHAGLRGGKYSRFTLGDPVQIQQGERLLDKLACRRCHISGGRGNALAVNLDIAASRRSSEELVLSIRRPVAGMPDFVLTEENVTELVNTLYAGSVGHEIKSSAPVRIHFDNSGKKNADVFSKKCGSCHRMLSERFGAIGNGNIAPNLSGLFSDFYPKTFKNNEGWTAQNLLKWLQNPRAVRPWARMQPVKLTDSEKMEIGKVFSISTETRPE
jgi:cytochrome c2